jgi:hypothetical protein
MSRIDDYNFARDKRNCSRCPERIFLIDEDGIERELPSRWATCDVCDGRGTCVNPAIDAGGLSEDFRDDPDFMDDYRRGAYDEPCRRCGGRTTIRVLDRESCEDELLALYDADAQAEAEYEAICRAERAMGA